MRHMKSIRNMVDLLGRRILYKKNRNENDVKGIPLKILALIQM